VLLDISITLVRERTWTSSRQEFPTENDFDDFMRKTQPTTMFIPKVDQKQHEQIMSKCKHKVVKKFALESRCIVYQNTPMLGRSVLGAVTWEQGAETSLGNHGAPMWSLGEYSGTSPLAPEVHPYHWGTPCDWISIPGFPS